MHRWNRSSPRIEVLEDRCLLACNIGPNAGSVITVKGDEKANTVVITDNGTDGNGNITIQCGSLSRTFDGPVSAIRVNTRGGKDSVTYNLASGLAAGVNREVEVELKQGNDTFVANLSGTVAGPSGMLSAAELQLDVHGNQGKDKLTVNNFLNIDAGARVRTNLSGDQDKDVLNITYQGVQDGFSFLKADGGTAKDIVTVNMQLNSGSNNTPGDAGDLAQVLGGNGKDKLTFKVTFVNPLDVKPIFALLDGGAGKDSCTATPNVTVTSCP